MIRIIECLTADQIYVNQAHRSSSLSDHFFVDESLRRAYFLVAGVVPAGRLTATRSLLLSLRLSGSRRIHFQAESDSRRREILSRLVAADLRTWVHTGRGKPETVRQACLAQLAAEAVKLECGALVLEGRERNLDAADRRTIAETLRQTGTETPFEYRHRAPYEEPLLWLPDAVAWSYGAGGDWRRRVAPLVETVVDLGDLRT